ncbi:MAG: type VI secretion system baseplate subunit TssF [Pirellulaceae bacterium]|nr:type VI secretion system baseplate subunit TssF [Pirellulaceae bacterium]
MDHRLLQYFNSELRYIRGMGNEFAKAYPKIAKRLNLDEFECADPYVERLLEGFAFLAARVQLKIDDEFPRLTQHLFEMIFPDYLCPTPSMAIVQFDPDLESGSLESGFQIPRQTSLRSRVAGGEQTSCEYRTAHDITLWPLQISAAEYFTRDTVNTSLPKTAQKARAGVRIECEAQFELSMDEIPCSALEFYLQGGPEQTAHMYEQIFANTVSIGIRDKKANEWLDWLNPDDIEPIGFSDDESLLPCRQRSFSGYRLVKEYFSFHQRFHFFRLKGIQRAFSRCKNQTIEIVILFNRADSIIETALDSVRFSLNCTPAVNLFPRRVERVHIDKGKHEFHVVSDRTRPMDLEIYQIDQVVGLGENTDEIMQFKPFYGLNASQISNAFYTTRRVPRNASSRQQRTGDRTTYHGSELYMALVDDHEAVLDPSIDQLEIITLCTNRDLPLSIPVGKSDSDFTMEISAPVKSVKVLVGPTAPKPSLANHSGEMQWRLVNHLSLNYLSIVNSDESSGAAALRELMKLYADIEEISLQNQIEGVRSIEAKGITRRLPMPGPISFGRGLEISVTLDDSHFEGYGVFTLGSVLAHFFSRYASINSFTETVLKTDERDEVKRWPPTIGAQKIL